MMQFDRYGLYFLQIIKLHRLTGSRAVESESEGILGGVGVGVGEKCTESDSDLSLKS
jgi:hypothetical protein